MTKLDTIKDVLGTWELIRVEYVQKYGEDPTSGVHIALLDRIERRLLSDKIQAERGTARPDKEKSVGEPATQKQLAYIIDLDGDPHWSGTKQEAMKYIDELKKK